MSKIEKATFKDMKDIEPMSAEKSAYTRFGIKFGHALLGQDNFSELDNKMFHLTKEACMNHFRDAIVEIAENHKVTIPMTLPFILDVDEMGEALIAVLDGYKMAKEGAPADCDLFSAKVKKCK